MRTLRMHRLLIGASLVVLAACNPDSTAPGVPAGGEIAFTSYRDASSDIYVMNADGSGARYLTAGGAPAWRPRGP